MRALGLILLLLLVPAPAAAQADFTMTYAACGGGADGWPDGAYGDVSTFTITRNATGGPSGQASCRHAIDYDAGAHDFGGQFNWGWRGVHSAPSQPGAGDSQYYRWRMRMVAGINYQCRDWSDGSPGNCTNKLLIVNDGCGTDPCRPILTMESDRSAGAFALCIQKDGGDDRACTGNYQEDVWLDVQLRITWSSATGLTDGSYALYIDNNTVGSPTASVSGIGINPVDNPGYTKFGGFMNNGVEAAGTWTFDHSDFTMGATFDATWDGSAPPAGTPVSLPFRTGWYAPVEREREPRPAWWWLTPVECDECRADTPVEAQP